MKSPNCPCESGKSYQECCEVFHLGSPAPTAEALMRSRYSAYVFGLESYLLRTWHPITRPSKLILIEDQPTNWLGLKIKQVKIHDENSATVEFVARYKVGSSKAERLHEISEFELLDRWYYHSGILR
ncbi:MAG: YchJ family protein [Methylophilaceae bacterium]